MEISKNMEVALITLIALAILLIIIGIASEVIGMLIDHECYQLEPNEFYKSSICERYWFHDEN